MSGRRNYTTCTQYDREAKCCTALKEVVCKERECRFYTTSLTVAGATPQMREKHREAQKRCRERWRANHRCVICGGEIEEEHLLTCRACRRYQAAKVTARRAQRTAASLCARCAAPLDERYEYINCPACREKYRQTMRRYLKPKNNKEET